MFHFLLVQSVMEKKSLESATPRFAQIKSFDV